jgi:hypothetical protein
VNLQEEIARSLIRGMGWRVARGMPWWLAVVCLLVLFALGTKGAIH